MDLESSLCEYRNGRFCMSDSIDVEEAFTIVEYLPVCDVGLLDFPNVRELEPRPALILSTAGAIFEFTGLETLPLESAYALARYRGEYLSFPKLTALDEELASAFGGFKCDLLLRGVESLSAAEARGLANHSGKIALSGLQFLSAEAAKHLARHRGSLLQLGMKAMDDEVAEAIAEYPGELHLLNLEHVSAKAAAAFVKRQPLPAEDHGLPRSFGEVMQRIDRRQAGRVAFGNLKSAPPEAIAALRNCPMVTICKPSKKTQAE